MTATFWFSIGGVGLSLALAAFFAGVESAYFSLSRSDLERMASSTDARERRVSHLMDEPRLFLATVLTGNTIATTAAASIAALITVDLCAQYGFDPKWAVAVEVVAVTLLVLYLSELIPKLQALRYPEKWSRRTSYILWLVQGVLYPIAWPLARVTGWFGKLFGIEQHSLVGMSEEEIRALVSVSHEHGAIETEEREMIHSIFRLGDTIASQVMVPRIDMVSVEKSASLDEVARKIIEQGHSRVPVYDGTIDNIIGVIHVKDLLKASQSPESFRLQDYVRKPHFVPEQKSIDELLREFQSEKVHLGIVVDEYGGTSGMVTLEDIIEEIVGEIQDEYDREQPMATRLEDSDVIVANGLMPIHELNQMAGFELVEESEAFDSLGGFVYSQLGVIPKRGDSFSANGYLYTVEEILGRRITRIRIAKEEGVFEDV